MRTIDDVALRAMVAAVDAAREAQDSIGGVFEVLARGVPPGLGSHVHWERRLDGRLGGALLSIQAVKAARGGRGGRRKHEARQRTARRHRVRPRRRPFLTAQQSCGRNRGGNLQRRDDTSARLPQTAVDAATSAALNGPRKQAAFRGRQGKNRHDPHRRRRASWVRRWWPGSWRMSC